MTEVTDAQVRRACEAMLRHIVQECRCDVARTSNYPYGGELIRIMAPFRIEAAMRAALEAAREGRDADRD